MSRAGIRRLQTAGRCGCPNIAQVSSAVSWMQRTPAFTQWADTLPAQINQGLSIERWGDLPQWQEVEP